MLMYELTSGCQDLTDVVYEFLDRFGNQVYSAFNLYSILASLTVIGRYSSLFSDPIQEDGVEVHIIIVQELKS